MPRLLAVPSITYVPRLYMNIIRKNFFVIGIFTALLGVTLPVRVYADSFKEISEDVAGFLGGAVLALLVGLTFMMFIINIYKMMVSTGDAGKRTEAKSRIIWSIILLFILTGVWGIISLLGAWLDIGLEGVSVG